MSYLFTSESVTEGHPDKLCDQISDAIVDNILSKDPNGRVAVETMVCTGFVMVTGEISTDCYIDIKKIVRDVVCKAGYDDPRCGFDGKTCAVLLAIDEQSSDIKLGVDNSIEKKSGSASSEESIGAGDQGMMFGFATDETSEFMPLCIVLAHKLAMQLAEVRKSGKLTYLRPDGKTQVTAEFDDEGNPMRIDTVLISAQHDPDVSIETMKKDLYENVVKHIIPSELMDENTKFLVNPTGRFVLGGPVADSGLTGRKIIVDTYGGAAKHGGGAFSGKDPTKVDRTAAYEARHIAKNIVAAGLCKRCEIQLSYAIGVASPISINVNTFGTAKVDEKTIEDIITKVFDMRPAAMIKNLDLRKPIYLNTASYGHFGRNDLDLTWEKLDKVDEIKALI